MQLPSGSLVIENGTVVFPATVWDRTLLVVLEGYYASTDGTVWSVRQSSLKKLSKSGRGRVGVYVDGKLRLFYVHRVMASTFLSGIRHAGQNEVDHIDVDHRNNALVNLRWATKKQNMSNRNATKAMAHRKRTRRPHSRGQPEAPPYLSVAAHTPTVASQPPSRAAYIT